MCEGNSRISRAMHIKLDIDQTAQKLAIQRVFVAFVVFVIACPSWDLMLFKGKKSICGCLCKPQQ